MGKLHEVLAVEGGLKATADKIIKEATDTFRNKRSHFLASLRSYEVIEEGTLEYAPEGKTMETTVKQKLDYVHKNVARGVNATYEKEVTNTQAKADLVVGDKTLAKEVPATFLLNMEGRLKELRDMYLAVPTLDPGKDWKKDSTQENVYLASETEQYKTEKVVKPLLLAQATKEHPAQVDKISMDKTVGKWKIKNWSGAISVTEKSEMIGRLDTLIRATKKARMRANDQEVNKTKPTIGKDLIDFITKG